MRARSPPAAVDAKHHLIAAHEVTNVSHDRDQLANLAKLAKRATGEGEVIVLADRGYYEGYEILAFERSGVAAVVPKPTTSNNLADGLFDPRDFVYDAKNDEYRCPAGKIAIYGFTAEEAGKTRHKYWSSDCPQCPMKPRCTTGKYRRITRWEYEDILDVVQHRLEGAPEAMKLRRQNVEHASSDSPLHAVLLTLDEVVSNSPRSRLIPVNNCGIRSIELPSVQRVHARLHLGVCASRAWQAVPPDSPSTGPSGRCRRGSSAGAGVRAASPHTSAPPRR